MKWIRKRRSTRTTLTREQALAGELRRLERVDSLGQFAAGIMHDANNLLATILSSAELIKEGLPAGSPLLPKTEAILQAGFCAAELNKQILSFSRTSEETHLPFDLSALVQNGLRMLRGTLPANIEMRCEITNGVWAEGDPIHLHRAILNLALNAIHAMRSTGGLLQVSLTETLVDAQEPAPGPGMGRFALLTVRDTGCGMDAATLERIFVPFFTTKAKGEGTGLGLAVVHALVTKAGGGITVASAPGQGAEFRVYWPCVTGPESPAADDPDPRRPEAGLILLAEDSKLTRTMVKAWLARTGMEVIEAGDGQEAWDLFTQAPHQGRFGLVLTDVVMPRMDGLELLRRIRNLDPGIPIAVLTSNRDEETFNAAQDLGADAFLGKPFGSPELAQCVERLLALRNRRSRKARPLRGSLGVMPVRDLPLFSLREPLTDAGGGGFRCMKCADGTILFLLSDADGPSALRSQASADFLGMLPAYVGECSALMAAGTAPGPMSCDRLGKIPCDPLRHLAEKFNQGIRNGPVPEVPIPMLLGLWTPATGRLRLLNAGLPHGLLNHRWSPEAAVVEINGTPLGLLPEPAVGQRVLQLQPGDRLLFGTEGFFGARSGTRQAFQEVAPERWGALGVFPIDTSLGAICEDARRHGDGVPAGDLLVIAFEQPV